MGRKIEGDKLQGKLSQGEMVFPITDLNGYCLVHSNGTISISPVGGEFINH